MIEEIKQTFFIWQNFGLCTILLLDGLTGRWLDFCHNMHWLVLFVLLCLQQVERAIMVSTKTCYNMYSKYIYVYYPFSCHSIPAMLKRRASSMSCLIFACSYWIYIQDVGTDQFCAVGNSGCSCSRVRTKSLRIPGYCLHMRIAAASDLEFSRRSSRSFSQMINVFFFAWSVDCAPLEHCTACIGKTITTFKQLNGQR